MTDRSVSPFRDTERGVPCISERAADVYDRALAAVNDGIFVSYVPENMVKARAEEVAGLLESGVDLPLAGTFFTVKDNLDVAGLTTSSNCPGFGAVSHESAPVIQAAEAAGAILIGKTTMDQFATGLNGTRTPGPLCRNAVNPDYIPGGSSSGSGVAVALGLGDFSFGSDTGGSGRVPAAANGIVGLKPTPGLVSSRGLVYCNRSFDVVPIFTKTVEQAFFVLEQVAGYDPDDAYSLPDASEVLLSPTSDLRRTLGVITGSDLRFFGDPEAEAAYHANIAKLEEAGFALRPVDYAPFREAGDLVFSGPLIAERLVDYGAFIQDHPDAVLDPVRQAIAPAHDYTAYDLYKALHRLEELKRTTRQALHGCDALVLPTIPRLFTIEEMLADPMTNNTVMGTYTYFANPLHMTAVSVPGQVRNDGLPSALCFVAPDRAEAVIRRLAQYFEGT